LKFFIVVSPYLLISSIACKVKHTSISLFIILSKQSADENLCSSIGFYSSIWFFKCFSFLFSFPKILYSSCILFFKICNCSGWFVFVSSFLLFLFDTISYNIFSSFLFVLYFYTNSQQLVFVDHLLRDFIYDLHLKKLLLITIFLHLSYKNNLSKKLSNHF